MKQKILALVFGWAALTALQSPAITVGPFGPQGEGGTKNGQSFTIGAGGSVFELDAFLNLGGLDLNGAQLGTSAQLSQNSLPPGLVYQFSPVLSADTASLVLNYSFSNTTATAFTNVRFLVLFDAEIDQAVNTFFNEYGTLKGVPGHGAADGSPDQWQIDEPGFTTGTLFRNLFLGSLNNSNSIPQTAPNDVAMSLGFSLGDLDPGGSTRLQVMISENGRSLGSLALIQRDLDPASKTFITLSGGLAPALEGGVFADANGNGVLDAGEGLPNVTVLLQTNGATMLQTTTDVDGRYSFSTAPGNYTVRVDPATLPPGLALVPVQDGATVNPSPITLVGGVSKTLNWGYRHPALEGRVYVDANTNGVFDATDQALSGVEVLLLSNAVKIAQVPTDANGLYSFGNTNTPNPLPGTYAVALDTNTLPPGLTLIPVQAGAVSNPTTTTLVLGRTNVLNWGFFGGGQSARLQFHFVAWQLNRAVGSLLGTVSLTNTNPPGSAPAPEPYWLGLHASTDFFYPHPTGNSDLPYVDLTPAAKALLGGGSLDPGKSLVLTNAVEVFGSTRTPPADGQFDWVPLKGP